jgi:hypothetical protein
VQTNIIDTRTQVLYQEIHVVTSGSSSSSSPPATNCGNGQLKQSPALMASNTWIYICLISLTPYDFKTNSRYAAEQSGFSTVNSSTGDQATLQWRNGYPSTTVGMQNMFYWGSSSSTSNGGWTYNHYLTPIISGPNLPSTSGTQQYTQYSGYLQGTVTVTVYPGVTYLIDKSVENNNHCQGYYTMQTADIGQTIWLDCCPSSPWAVGTGDTACPSCGWHTTTTKNYGRGANLFLSPLISCP